MIIHRRSEQGFTIQELLVVLFAGSLLLSFSLSLLLFAGKLFTSWERGSELRRAVHRVIQLVGADTRKADRFEAMGDSALVLNLSDERRIEYRFSGGRITRNDVSLSLQDGPLLWVSIDDGVSFHIRAESRGKEYALQARLTIQPCSHSDIMDELVALREDLSWEALKKH